jgi:hypothetical protein
LQVKKRKATVDWMRRKKSEGFGFDEQLMARFRLPYPITARVSLRFMNMTEKPKGKVAEALWKRILVPISFAPSSEESLMAAFGVSRRQWSELFVIHAAHDPIIQSGWQSVAGIGASSLPGNWLTRKLAYQETGRAN